MRSLLASFQILLDELREDIDRYAIVCDDKYPWWSFVLGTQGVWAIMQYRFSRWVHYQVDLPIVRFVLKVFCVFWRKLVDITTGIEISNRAEIGKGLFIPHSGGIVVHSDVKIGSYCTLSHNVTLGIGGRGDKKGCPVLGDCVYIAPGAKIFGKITIGHNVAIGANAVVTKDLLDSAVAVGIPAKTINYDGSNDFITLRKIDSELLNVLEE